ncbi:competence/damage-inducible protein A [Coprobacter tertius]|uniref:CinA-like protein n=1 Tax=Coprobacter tertius TaxID=2944915 RepID=A0ABT1MF17_9BACT|nr:competence/damage-inducible protein A [Coprobacter tertius]MCP9611225.1 competence/damage-inducible protein A [Coprobacter tertius]
MNVEIIVIGDELLIGQVTDTNSAWIARELNKIGWEITEITTVRDRREEMLSAFNQSFARVNVVLVTGGLGPTKDDMTKQTLCDFFGGKMIFDDSVLQNIERWLSKRKIKLNDSTRSQAMVPDVCSVIQNPVGTAPVMWFEREGKVLVSMPGVPFEMKNAMENEVIPRLRHRFPDHTSIRHFTCLVMNFTESALSEYLTDFEAEMPSAVKLAYLPNPGVIRLRLTARGEDDLETCRMLEKQAEKLCGLLGKNIFSYRDTTMAGALGAILEKEGYTVATAESCTGGNIAHEITLIPGSSAYYKGSIVSYANEIKETVLGVSTEDLEKYGAVSRQVVEQMVKGVQKLMHTDCAVATSGVAGPNGGTSEKPVGTVWIAVALGDKIVSEKFLFGENRKYNIERATHMAFLSMIKLLSGS